MTNWCGWEWGFKFTIIRDRIKKLKFLDPKKVDKLYHDIEVKVCNPHDEDFALWGGILDFYRANYMFIERLLRLLHWTNTVSRLLVFIVVFIWLSTVWVKYFNWTHVLKR